MSKLTYKQKANLFHLLVIFPIFYLAMFPETINSLDKKTITNIAMFLLIAGTLFHVYLFIHVNQKSVTFAQ